MRKFVCLTAALILSLFEVALVNTGASAQEYPSCFMVTQSGKLVNLNLLCQGNTETPQQQLVFTNLESQPILGGTIAQVRGTVTNSSSQVVRLSRIYFQLVADNRILASNAVPVEKRDGLKPGESLSFDKVINKSDLGNVPFSKIKVEITKYH